MASPIARKSSSWNRISPSSTTGSPHLSWTSMNAASMTFRSLWSLPNAHEAQWAAKSLSIFQTSATCR